MLTTNELNTLESFRSENFRDGNPILPEALSTKIGPATGRYETWGRMRRYGLREMHIQTADSILQFVVDLAFVCLALGDKDSARASLRCGFNTLTNCVYWGVRSGQRSFDGPGVCCCNFAETLGNWANRCGFPELADSFGRSTYCPTSPQYGPGPYPASGVKSQGFEVPIDEISEEIKQRIVGILGRLHGQSSGITQAE